MLDSQSLEKPGLEDAHQCDLTSLFPLVILVVRDRFFLLVRFYFVGSKSEVFDGFHNISVEPAVGRAKAVRNAVQLAFGENNRLSLDRGVRIGSADVRSGVTNHDLFEKIEEDDTFCGSLLIDLLSSPLEVGVQVTDTRLAEVVRLALREETNLAREVEDIVIDRSGGKQDDLLADSPSRPRPPFS